MKGAKRNDPRLLDHDRRERSTVHSERTETEAGSCIDHGGLLR
jgi:hypothetical protein